MTHVLLINKKGITLLEVVIAIFLMSIAVLALFDLQAPAMKSAARADYLGRAAEIMNSELEQIEFMIMNPSNTVPENIPDKNVKVSHMPDGSIIDGDMTYTVTTKIENVTENLLWKVTVKVTWPPLNSAGITSQRIISRQDFFKS